MKATAENYKRAVMLMDRIVLVDQTSQRLDKYKLDHGVYQANHWRYRPLERLQVCSAQTLERRDNFPETDLLIVDECHIARRQTIEFIKSRPNMKVIGLTATPFTKGLGDVYTNVVTGSPTEFLVTNKWLAPLRVFIAKEIDMTGAKKVAGEWSTDEVTERGIKLTGDIVETWIKKTHEIFGGPRKTIVFCAGVAHGSDLVEQFARHGYNFVSISYKDDDEFKRDAIADFSKPDTEIHGLIATDILTRGFDVPDVMIGVSARPFSKSLSSHVQQMGRVMRSYRDKEFGVWLDHSGNYLRFRDDWDKVYAEGVDELDSTVDKPRKEPTEKEKKESKCPVCGFLWPAKADVCAACGHVRQRLAAIQSVPGEMEELGAGNRDDRQKFYSQLLYISNDRGYNRGWAAHKYKERFGVWPRGLEEKTMVPDLKIMNWIRSRQIAWAKSQRRKTA
jgi:superfamily II DNA or RNA helicase